MFIKTNDRIVNLKNVSNINILGDRKRIIFNLNYNIQIASNYKTKFISDYVYWECSDAETLATNLKTIYDDTFFSDNFINQIDERGFVNKNEISSIKFSEKKNRVIFNLSHPVTFKDYDGNERLTSEFVYVNCKNYNEYTEYKEYIKTKIGETDGN